MIGINHVLSGGIIGAVTVSPIAIPLAFISHFVLDALPHYGIDENMERSKDVVWKIDLVLVCLFVLFMMTAQSDVKFWASIGALSAASPDLAWVYRFSVQERFGTRKPRKDKNKFNKFHADIQKYESSSRLWIEATALVVFTALFVRIAL